MAGRLLKSSNKLHNTGMRRNIFPKAAKYAVRHCRVHCCKRSAIEGKGIKMNRIVI
jgi:hypothetical protein